MWLAFCPPLVSALFRCPVTVRALPDSIRDLCAPVLGKRKKSPNGPLCWCVRMYVVRRTSLVHLSHTLGEFLRVAMIHTVPDRFAFVQRAAVGCPRSRTPKVECYSGNMSNPPLPCCDRFAFVTDCVSVLFFGIDWFVLWANSLCLLVRMVAPCRH